jgi:dipeptidyl aminopeptidase/acylaminoacyl peptidase
MNNISGISVVTRKSHRKWKIIIMSLLIIVLLLIIAVGIISAVVGWKLIHPEREEIPKFSSNVVIEYKDVEFKDIKDTINLKGWYFKAKDSDKTVVMAHGYGENRLQFNEKTFDMVKKFQEKGYNMLLFDFRNSGMSGGDKTTIGIYEKDDLLGAVNFVKSQGSKHIVLLGYSMGAAASITAAAESQDVNAVIADSSFADLETYLNDNMSKWSGLPSFPFNNTILFALKIMAGVEPKDISPIKDIEKIAPRPVMLIHGTDDRDIPYKNSEELKEAYLSTGGRKVTLWEVPGARHVQSYEVNPTEYMDRVFDFLGQVFPQDKK